MTGTTKSTTPCVFCGTAGSLSTEHVMPRWLRKALQIREPVREFSGTACVGAAETLAIVFHEVCVSCNTGWMESLERDACPVLGPSLLGAAPSISRMLDPGQQAILATWAVMTALLLATAPARGPGSVRHALLRHGPRQARPGTGAIASAGIPDLVSAEIGVTGSLGWLASTSGQRDDHRLIQETSGQELWL